MREGSRQLTRDTLWESNDRVALVAAHFPFRGAGWLEDDGPVLAFRARADAVDS